MEPLYAYLSTRRGRFRWLATQLGISTAAVSQWFKRGSVPARFVLPIERLTGVSRHLVRPDLYPVERA